ncbi:Prepilin-type cleavage/methylation-like protein [Leifsonia rubra CMS 76R]|nr:Prepilin-type cleavage/methylation-like protein [Leifsonia rubra CMS 76R]
MVEHSTESEDPDDSGFTLTELIVAVGVFTLFMAMMVSTVVVLSHGATRTQLVGQSTNSAITMFGALDRQVRYSDAINYPGPGVSGNRYVEFRTPAESTVSQVIPLCTQWKFDPTASTISSRSWNDTPSSTATPWVLRISNVIDDQTASDPYPFRLVPAGITGSALQQLDVKLHAGNEARDEGVEFTSSFVARNSSIRSESNADFNADQVSDTPVCVRAGSRA